MEAALQLVESPDIQAIETKTSSIVGQAQAQAVTTPAEFEAAADLLLRVKECRKEIAATFGPIKAKQYDAWKECVAQEKRHDEPLVLAESILKGKIADYSMEQERKRREEEARLQAEANKKAEEEKLREAVALEAAGETEAAEQALDAPSYVAPVVVPSSTPKVTGISTRMEWDFQILDTAKVPEIFKVVDEKKIRAQVKSLGANCKIPGVRVFQRPVVAAGRRF